MSYPRFDLDTPHRQKQRGAAFIVMLVVMVLGVAAVLVGSLNSAGLKIGRDVKTATSLALAKDAIIGKAVISNDFVGGLYCPDTTGDGESNGAGNGVDCSQYIGLLPYKTLGLPDLRDSSGAKLWYTLSRNVRRYPSVVPLNSDTAAIPANKLLSVSGNYSANELVAIVFAPGENISGQSRSDITASCTTTGDSRKESLCAANYLEGTNDDPSNNGTQNTNYQSSNSGIEFNDQIITITLDQLFTPVEKRVAREIRSLLMTYHSTWNEYPYAAPFMDPSSAYTTSIRPFIGDNGTYSGLLPMGAVWTGIPTYTVTGGGSVDVDSCELRDGYNSLADARWRCDINSISGNPTIHITGTLKGLRLWRPHNLSDSTQARVQRNGTSYPAASIPGMNATVSYTPKANGDVDVTFTGVLSHSDIERIELRDVLIDSAIDPVDSNYGWFTRNNWHHVMHFAVSPGFAPSGGNSCTPLPDVPSCLAVNGNSASNNNQALVIMTGRTLTGQSRSASLALCSATGTNIATAACISNYLEGQNETPADYIFENQPLSATFNDQVIIVAP